jgi:hypothetical protein
MTHDPARDPEAMAPAAEPAPPLTPAPAVVPVVAAEATTSASTDDVAFRERTPGPNRLRVGLGAGAAVALAVGAVATSLAATPAPGLTDPSANGSAPAVVSSAWVAPAAIGGLLDGANGGYEHGRFGGPGGLREITVTAISGPALSLETTDGWTRTVTVTDDVGLTKGGQPIELSDIAVGDQIRLRQEVADDGTVTVTGILVVVPTVAGEVSDLTATSFRLTGRDGAVWTITLTADTVYTYGTGEGSLADIANGDMVLVQGTSTGDNALTATSVAVRGDQAHGTVTATTASTITIETRGGTSVTIHVDADTVYRAAGDEDATLADIAVDDVIGVSGRERSDGSIDADVVM